jgi:hypothetical protein
MVQCNTHIVASSKILELSFFTNNSSNCVRRNSTAMFESELVHFSVDIEGTHNHFFIALSSAALSEETAVSFKTQCLLREFLLKT